MLVPERQCFVIRHCAQLADVLIDLTMTGGAGRASVSSVHLCRVSVCTAGRSIKKIWTNDDIIGVTSVDDELFALLQRDDNQVAVYSINDYQLLRYIHLPGLEGHIDNDMTSCERRKCLYASDYYDKCIHRYELSSRAVLSKWPVPGSPRGLSLTHGRCNLLITCRDPSKLVELRADSGQYVREITLQQSIENLHHAVQLTTRQHAVCHGITDKNLHRVCLVNVEGRITCSYGGQHDSVREKLYEPRHLAENKNSQFVFVADQYNNRVVLLSPTLEFVCHIREEVLLPRRLYFHQTTQRLFVGQGVGGGGVDVIQL